MSIQSDVNELNNILAEIKRLNKSLASLRKRKTEVETRIADFLNTKDQHGVKYRGMAIIAEDTNKVLYKSKKDRKADGIATLQKYGIHNPDSVLDEVIKAMKGEEKSTKKIKIKKFNTN